MEGPVFVDTNVLVYHRDSTEPAKQRRAAEWMARLWDEGTGRVSVQVLHEYYVTVTRKLDPGLPQEEAREDIAALRAWNPLSPDAEILEYARAVQDRYGLSFWDAMIVAAAWIGTDSWFAVRSPWIPESGGAHERRLLPVWSGARRTPGPGTGTPP